MPRKKKVVAESVVVTEVKPSTDKPKKVKNQVKNKQVEEKPIEEFKTEVQAEFVPKPATQTVNKFKPGDYVRCKVRMEIRYSVHSLRVRTDKEYPIVYKCYDDCGNLSLICEDMLVLD